MVRLSGLSLTEGIESHRVEGVPVRVYSAAKAVADCFKFRNRIGLDVAIEALKESLRGKKASINDIYTFAKICRVSNAMSAPVIRVYPAKHPSLKSCTLSSSSIFGIAE